MKAGTTWMFEVYYSPPADLDRERQITAAVGPHGGWLQCREATPRETQKYLCLTYEFDSEAGVEAGARAVRAMAEYLEGPYPYS